MQFRFVTVALAFFLWWTHATAVELARPVVSTTASAAIEQIERLDSLADQSAFDDAAAPIDRRSSGDPSGPENHGADALDMPAMLMAIPAAPVPHATMARPGLYTPAAWLAPDLGVPQRPPSATTFVA